MRIVAGEWRGRRLAAPKGDRTRPTADRTRETLFNMLASRLGSFEGLAVADLFAGSGALGLEALSRGADRCLFVEQDAAALAALRANIAAFDGGGRASVRARSVTALGPMVEPLDLLLLDPPYRTGAGIVALERLLRLGWIGPASWVVLEAATDEAAEVRGLETVAERRVGRTRLALMRLPQSCGG